MLPPLSYSSQHAAFNLTVLAVGHHTLPSSFLFSLMFNNASHYIARLGIPSAALFTSWALKSPKPDMESDSISFGLGMNSQNHRKPLVR